MVTTHQANAEPMAEYRIFRRIGGGATSDVFFALHSAGGVETPVVIKRLRREFVERGGGTSATAAIKEAAALGLVHEFAPCPHVVRLYGHGTSFDDEDAGGPPLPWVALEYVQGGPAGTTLAERISSSIRSTGHAFGAERAARAVRAMGLGLGAVHAAGVVHRDVKPSNVLVRGAEEDESILIADFGVSRPPDLALTFGGLVVGTPGHAPPEQASLDRTRVGPWSDVFGFATVIYSLLTGEDYFLLRAPSDALWVVRHKTRRSLIEAPALVPELRAGERSCREIDAALAWATDPRPEARPQTAMALAQQVASVLETVARNT